MKNLRLWDSLSFSERYRVVFRLCAFFIAVVVVFVVSSVSFIRSFFQTSNEDALLAKVSGDRDFSDLF